MAAGVGRKGRGGASREGQPGGVGQQMESGYHTGGLHVASPRA